MYAQAHAPTLYCASDPPFQEVHTLAIQTQLGIRDNFGKVLHWPLWRSEAHCKRGVKTSEQVLGLLLKVATLASWYQTCLGCVYLIARCCCQDDERQRLPPHNHCELQFGLKLKTSMPIMITYQLNKTHFCHSQKCHPRNSLIFKKHQLRIHIIHVKKTV